ncbi:MAG TPA: hypothetical protein VJ598_03600 [Albitalea sp.]|nr:hypothetical protein [Albitalea sp.]
MNVKVMQRTRYELRFQSLADAKLSYAFPCDAAGHVDMDSLSHEALNDYLYARAVVGCELQAPSVCASAER